MEIAILTVLLLAVMEVSLSFDNAIVNASVLKNMSALWQHRFITWGMLVSVVGMRLLIPLSIVMIAGGIGASEALNLAFTDPSKYSQLLASSHNTVNCFGGMFLLVIFLDFIFDEEKTTHWIPVEKHLTKLSESAKQILHDTIILCVFCLIFVYLPKQCFVAAVAGFLTHFILGHIIGDLGSEDAPIEQGFMRFLYLEVLDASFSFDGVGAAFAITNNIITIMIGLGIGSFAIRSLTLRLVHTGKLSQYIYLEHGAHYSIGTLGTLMLLGLPISGIVTGLIAVTIIATAFISSLESEL